MPDAGYCARGHAGAVLMATQPLSGAARATVIPGRQAMSDTRADRRPWIAAPARALDADGLPAARRAGNRFIAGHLQISYAAVAALKTDRPLPIGEARSHPALCVQRSRLDRQRKAWNRDAPRDRDFASFDLSQ